MKLTLNWLREFVDLPETAEEVGRVLAGLGFKPEAIEPLALDFSGVVVAEVLEARAHPDADRIRVVDIDTGSEQRTVVCGAWNFGAGATVVYAPPGSVLAGGLEVGSKEIRGVDSPGMIASERELGLSDEHEGILVLPPGMELGSDFGDAVGLPDVMLDLEINANRPDCMSVLGVARELAAYFGRELREPAVDLPDAGGGPAVTVGGGCARFVARRVHGVAVGPSPPWMQTRLRAAGVRPLTNIVDATNYAMLELGHPTHAFDADALGDTIVVRRASPGEGLRTLDGVDRELDPADIVVTDGRRARALGGVMGGEDSEVSPESSEIIVEAAYFDPPSIMRTASRHGLHSEASIRFQRGMDPNAPRRAADRVARLIVEYGGGEPGGVTDAYPSPASPAVVGFDIAELPRVLGRSFEPAEVRSTLEPLGFGVADGDVLSITVPTRRVDVTTTVDFVEEIARFWGYDNFDKRVAIGPGHGLPEREARYRLLRESMVASGYYETATFSFIGQADLDGLALPDDDPRRRGIPVTNPLRAEEGVMRTTLLPGLMKATAANLGRRIDDVPLFETGKVFLPGPDDIPFQPETLAFVAVGTSGGGWFGGARHRDVHDALGLAHRLAADLGVSSLELEPTSVPALHPGRTAAVIVNGEDLGAVGELHPRVAAAFGIEETVVAGELRIEALLEPVPAWVFSEPSSYPPVIFDIAFDLPHVAAAGRVSESLRAAGSDLVERIDLFDVFTGPPLDDDRKSLAFRVMLRAADRTLTDEEAAEVRRVMSDAVASDHDGILRSG